MIHPEIRTLVLAGLTFFALAALFRFGRVPGFEAHQPSKLAPRGLMASAFAAGVGLMAVALGTLQLETYGWALFVFVPVLIGFLSVLLADPPRRFEECVRPASLSLAFVGLGLLGLAVEGFVCLLMACPFALLLSLCGAALAYPLRRRMGRATPSPALLLLLVLSAPFLMGVEAAARPASPVFRVTTEVVVDALPAVVWKNVVSFSELPPPDDWVFRTGIAYPVRAEIRGHGVGAVRRCVFSTGAFVEPITVWDEPRRLAFSVTHNPPSMHELSPWGDIHPPHLEGFLVSHRGEFRLEPLPGGRTRLIGTTWYEHGLRPAWYWRLWSDAILHRIHQRVLRHVARLSEAQARGAQASPTRIRGIRRFR